MSVRGAKGGIVVCGREEKTLFLYLEKQLVLWTVRSGYQGLRLPQALADPRRLVRLFSVLPFHHRMEKCS
jgi:hypothetical protein